jgi:hypothetical protein
MSSQCVNLKLCTGQKRAIVTLVLVEKDNIIAYNQKEQAIIVFTTEEISMSMRKIYRELAKKHGVSVKEIRQDMQAALTEAYTDPLNNNVITKAYQNRVPRQGEIPTPEEAVRYLAGEVKKNRA